MFVQRLACRASFIAACGATSLALLLTGCSSPQPPPPAPVAVRPPSYRNGMRLYPVYCAKCHDAGNAEAPTLDDIEAWDERAFQWESVLQLHASRGFLDMPPQGGEPGLSEQSLNDMLFYMLTRIKALDEET